MICGDALNVLKTLEDHSIDSLVTDPPAGISFMGKDWDHHKGGRDEWVKWMTEIMTECLRVLKPGAHGLVWALPRTSHWTATALENAGFEVRDVVTHLFGTGFPKSLDISKAIDKAAGAEREVVGIDKSAVRNNSVKNHIGKVGEFGLKAEGTGVITAPSTSEAKQWSGWGTALKPASEHWVLVRKPCSEKTVAANVLKHGCGGINIDGCRVGSDILHNQQKDTAAWSGNSWSANPQPSKQEFKTVTGRFPANLILDEVAAEMLDEQSGTNKGGNFKEARKERSGASLKSWKNSSIGAGTAPDNYGDSGGASRFFYCAKSSKSDRGEGNVHPTVKSTKLMDYLIKLITPPGGTVLDPFMGSGSTGVAAKSGGWKFIGIEQNKEYFEIAEKRLKDQDR